MQVYFVINKAESGCDGAILHSELNILQIELEVV